MKKLEDGSMVFSTHVHMRWRSRNWSEHEAVVPNPQTASHLLVALTRSNEIVEDSVICHDVETGVYLGHLSTAPEPQARVWSAEQVLTP